MRNRLLSTLAFASLMAMGLNAQQPPVYFQTSACLKVTPGKSAEYRQFVKDTSKKMAEARANAGEIVSWALMRSVMPAGTEARCDYIVSTTYDKPPKPSETEDLAASLEKSGIKMTAPQYLAKRDSLAHLVNMELWENILRVGHPQKGNYVLLNHMKVLNADDYYKFEADIWRPMAEEWAKDGSQNAWQFGVLLFPGGTDVKFAAKSADIYPSWEAVFKGRTVEPTFKKVHPGKDYDKTMASMTNLRELAQRDLLVIEDRVEKK